MKTVSKIIKYAFVIIFVSGIYIIVNSFDIGIKYNNIRLIKFAESIGLAKEKDSDLILDIMHNWKLKVSTLEYLIKLGYVLDRKDGSYNAIISSINPTSGLGSVYNNLDFFLNYKDKFRGDINKIINDTMLEFCYYPIDKRGLIVFSLLFEHGADPYAKDEYGDDCIRRAKSVEERYSKENGKMISSSQLVERVINKKKKNIK
ncbi:MAG: hypothetical protein GY932_10975 [Arcobacter sp.]|nr:hypothetical protein [Arcobacter sp.]